MSLGMKLTVPLTALLAVMTIAFAGAECPAYANDQCIARCIKLENDCRIRTQGQGNCNAIASQCMASCRQK